MPAEVPATPGADLLAELRQAAAAASEREAAALHARHTREQAIGRQMRQLFNYLAEFCRHLDTLRAPIPTAYRVAPHAVIDGLAWQESFIDYRTESSSEIAPINAVTCRYTLAAPGSVTAYRAAQGCARFRDDLSQFGLRYVEHEPRDGLGVLGDVAFDVARDVRVWLRFTPDFDSGRITLETRNFRGLGPARYYVAAEALDTALLEALGHYILGRPNTLFNSLHADLSRL